jgi:putative CocE/NonD family hydrolase
VRVDIRGTGESGGLIFDEYTRQKHDDTLEVIAWLARQPWCSGAVGMMGISWGGFNALQMAALRPPALRAICSPDDRYRDDAYRMGGALLANGLGRATRHDHAGEDERSASETIGCEPSETRYVRCSARRKGKPNYRTTGPA